MILLSTTPWQTTLILCAESQIRYFYLIISILYGLSAIITGITLKILNFKSKIEADKVFHTYDEKRIYNLENVPTEKTQFINNRMSMVSGVSQLSKMTGLTGTTGTAGSVNWNNVLNKVPPVEEFAGDLHGRAGSALSNVTDVTINENRINMIL